MSDLDLEAIKVRVDAATPPPWTLVGGARRAADAVFIAHAREDIPALVAEVERLRRALRSIAYTDHMTGPAARFARNALNRPRPLRRRSPEASEPRCELCGYDQHVAHHLSGSTKGYHPFVSSAGSEP